jgi:hypothetical protein
MGANVVSEGKVPYILDISTSCRFCLYTQGKYHQYPAVRKQGRPQCRRGDEKNILPKIEPRPFNPFIFTSMRFTAG